MDILRKMKVNGAIDKYKARLVVKVFKQKEGLHYFDTYSSLTSITSIRMLIALATIYNLEIHQMDVKRTFFKLRVRGRNLHGKTREVVFSGKEIKVFKLMKSLYELKQALK